MRRYRNFGFPIVSTSNRGATTSRGATTTVVAPSNSASSPPATKKNMAVNPVVAENVKVISNNKNLTAKQKKEAVKQVITELAPREKEKTIVPRPPSFKPAPSPPVVTVPPVTTVPPTDPDAERIREEEERRRKIAEEEARRDEAFRKQEEARRLAEEADRQQQQPAPPVNVIPLPIVEATPTPAPTPAPTPIPSPTPAPPAQVIPSPKTSIRRPTAIPRTYSRNMRVSFRAPRLMLPKPTMRKLQPRPTKQKWKAMNPTYPSFMNRVKHGQFSFQNRGRLFPQPARGHSHAEIRKLQQQVNKLNADALKTRQDSMRERQALKLKLRDYELSPLTQIRDQAKGIFSVVDDASRFATPSVNGMNGFPSVGEGTSKALAVGFGLLTALFVIGRVE